MELRSGESVSFASYFNYFSLSKWKKYTTIEDLTVFLNFEGRSEIQVDRHTLENGKETVNTISSTVSDGGAVLNLRNVPDTGMLSVSVTALSDVRILGGGFRTDAEPLNDIRIGINVCTYRREKDIIDKIEMFNSFLSSSDNAASNAVEMFVTDNGGTLDNSLVSKNVHIIPNRNLGGSGGFTRGMMEITDSKRFTHILMNDDDASFDPESVYRTRSFLSFLKKEYEKAHIGGAMLMSETPNIVYESGALYSHRGRTLRSAKRGLNLSDTADCLRFDEEEEIDSFGWWYHVMPITYITEEGYPLPLFIKHDDIEYNLRKRSPMITLNGISVWHDTFNRKLPVSNHYSYYYARNYLVVGCTTHELKRCDVTWMIKNAMFEAVCLRYEHAEMMLKGVGHFLKGPEFVFDQCLDGMIRPVPVDIENIDDLREKAEFTDSDTLRKRHYFSRMFTLNGMLLRPKRNIETGTDNMESSDFYRAGKVLYNTGDGKGFIVERSIGRTFSALARSIRLWFKALFLFGRLKRRYRRSLKKYSSEENWRSIFGQGTEDASNHESR